MNITNIGPDLLVVIDGSTGIPGVAGNFRPGVPSVDDGKVAFLTDNTAVPATYTGIYFKDGPFLSKVIGTNDTLDGKQVSDLDFGPEGLSGDQIAFQAHFSDGSTGIFIANLEPGFSSTNPILPIDVPEGCDACPNLPSRNACLACLTNNRPCFEFCVVPNSTWVDPPMAAGFEYRMTSDSLFTAVVDFPTGFDALIVSVDGQPLPGTYGEGDSVDFGDGVQVFSILGISPLVDATQPDVFPVKLAFSTDTASFTMRPLICPPSPTPGCEEGWEKTRLLIKESSPGKEKLVAKFLGGPELSQGDFGTPLVPDGAEYSLCLYTGTGSLAGEVSVIGSGAVCGEKECWKAIGGYPPDGKGLKYADTAASSDGVRLFKLLGGQLGKSRILIKAKNNANKDQLMMPTGIAKSLSTTESVTMQLVRSDTGACFSSNLSDLRRQEADLFKAK